MILLFVLVQSHAAEPPPDDDHPPPKFDNPEVEHRWNEFGERIQVLERRRKDLIRLRDDGKLNSAQYAENEKKLEEHLNHIHRERRELIEKGVPQGKGFDGHHAPPRRERPPGRAPPDHHADPRYPPRPEKPAPGQEGPPRKEFDPNKFPPGKERPPERIPPGKEFDPNRFPPGKERPPERIPPGKEFDPNRFPPGKERPPERIPPGKAIPQPEIPKRYDDDPQNFPPKRDGHPQKGPPKRGPDDVNLPLKKELPPGEEVDPRHFRAPEKVAPGKEFRPEGGNAFEDKLRSLVRRMEELRRQNDNENPRRQQELELLGKEVSRIKEMVKKGRQAGGELQQQNQHRDFGDKPRKQDFGNKPRRQEFGNKPKKQEFGDKPKTPVVEESSGIWGFLLTAAILVAAGFGVIALLKRTIFKKWRQKRSDKMPLAFGR